MEEEGIGPYGPGDAAGPSGTAVAHGCVSPACL